jgi:hypothetical protein
MRAILGHINPWTLTLLVFLINLPFGYWRAGCKKLSPAWFAAIHIPVPLVILLRVGSGIGFRLWTVPLTVGAFFGGQYAGGRLRSRPLRGGDPGSSGPR